LNSTTGIINFTPVDEDVGYHLVTVNTSDGKSVISMDFNFTVYNLEDAPVINLPLSAINATVNLTSSNINATENSFTVIYINITDNDLKIPSNQKAFYSENISLGLMIYGPNANLFNFTKNNSYPSSALTNISLFYANFTPNTADVGDYNITVNISDVNGSSALLRFNLTIKSYDTIEIMNQPAGYNFSAVEGNVSNITVSANHTIAGNLTYVFYLDNALKYTLSYYGDATNLTWGFIPNYTDESYGVFKNISLVVYNSLYPALNVSRTWNINITHADSPINFIGNNISNQTAAYDSAISINLNSYFSYPDKDDAHYNRTISSYAISSNANSSAITASFTPSTWILMFSSSSAINEVFNVTLSTTLPVSSATSNNFLINFTTPVTSIVTTPSSGGGGGSTKYHSLKIMSPDEIIVSDKNYIEIPISVKNTGSIELIGINLSGIVSFDNFVSEDVTFGISNTFIERLSIGEAKNLTVMIHANTHKSGRYKVSVYASVLSPKFTDWGEFFIDLKKANETETEQLLLFAEKIIFDNPECLELTELLNGAQTSYNEGNITESISKTREVIQACRAAIEGKDSSVYSRGEVKTTIYYMAIITLAVLFIWAAAYFYKKIKFNKARREGYV